MVALKGRTRDLGVALGLASVSALALIILRTTVDSNGLALGSDPVLWGLSARNIAVGASTAVPPLFPALIRLLDPIRGMTVVSAGLALSAAIHCLIAPATFWCARRLGAARWLAAIAGLATLNIPTLMAFGLHLQPDGLTTLLLLLSVPLSLNVLQRPGVRHTALLCAFAAAAAITREHGLALTAALMGIMLWSPGAPVHRAMRAAALAVAVILSPMLVGAAPGLPQDMPWMARIDMALAGAEKEPSFHDADMDARSAAHVLAHEESDRLGIQSYHLWRSLRFGHASWVWVLAGLGAAAAIGGRRRWATLAPIATAAPALIIFSQPRHVAVATPVAVAAVAAAGSLTGPWALPLAAAGAVTASVWNARTWKSSMRTIRSNRETAVRSKAQGAQLCAMAQLGDLLYSSFPDATVYCLLPQHRVTRQRTGADWRTWAVGRQPNADGWEEVGSLGYSGPDPLTVWRLRPALKPPDRPCSNSMPAPDTPFLMFPEPSAVLEPACN